jgi:predicted metal-dependent hydrolase
MSPKTLNITGIGEVLFTLSQRSRRLRITIKTANDIVISMPQGFPMNEAIRFVESKADWIHKQQKKLNAGLTKFSPETCFKTKFHTLSVHQVQTARLFNRAGNGRIQIFIPEHVPHDHPRIQDFIQKTLIQVMRYEAKIYLPKRLQELAEKHGFRYQDVTIKNTKTRWGSCSGVNNINLNLHLMRLPDPLIDYVLLHELVHTVEKNHGPGFWRKLEQCYPGARQADREMQKYRTQTF